ncbi:MAG: FliH/SctL family protein [Armatimonadota bacterium]|jgi:flagellar biosynthesis/type III secretory pathway protein FliH|nr:FliH/SctL family protein [Armatimonadota bacterium]
MPVLPKPLYRPQPVPWEKKECPMSDGAMSNEPMTNETMTNEPMSNERGMGGRGDETPRNAYPMNQSLIASRQSLSEWRQEVYEAGYRDGFLAGQQEGYRMGVAAAERQHEQEREQWRQKMEHLVATLGDELRGEIANWMGRMEELLTELALEIARKVVEVEISTNPEIVRHAVNKSLQELRSGTITIRLHPDDFALLEPSLPLLNLQSEGLTVRFVADEGVEKGGVIAESDQGVVDLQPSTKFALLKAEVL